LLGAAIVGAALGGAVVRSVAPETRMVYIDRAVPGPTVIEIASAPTPALPSARAPEPLASSQRHAPAASAESIDARGLAAERMLLDAARSALARGEPDEALAATERHAATYPRGVLREEREALAVKALASAGRYAEARARGERFRAEFPRSVSLASVNATLASLPE
jgi:hypothetical protein